jgi:hypothetical protein
MKIKLFSLNEFNESDFIILAMHIYNKFTSIWLMRHSVINLKLITIRAFGVVFCFILMSCSLVATSEEQRDAARALISTSGWSEASKTIDGISLFTAYKSSSFSTSARVYIEGDGSAFTDSSQISNDPTPRPTMFLKLALADESTNVIYVARPCQYLLKESPACTFRDWSFDRFNSTQLTRISRVLDDYRNIKGITSFELVGFSGGAAIALSLAAERSDISSVRTIAGNVALAEFIRMHSLEPFSTDADPMLRLGALRRIPQLHIVSSNDKVIPPDLTRYYLKALSSPCAKLEVVESPSHSRGWELPLRSLLHSPLPECPRGTNNAL